MKEEIFIGSRIKKISKTEFLVQN